MREAAGCAQEYWKNIFVLYLKLFTPKYLPSVYMYKTLLFAQELPNRLKSKTKANKSQTGYPSPGRTAAAPIQLEWIHASALGPGKVRSAPSLVLV